MTKQEKNEVIEVLKEKFGQYNNFCFDKNVEMKVAKNTLIRKAMEALDAEKYAGVYDSLHQVTALMFTENPKDPALIISSFREKSKGEKPVLKAAFINGEVYMGDGQLKALTKIKTKQELIGEVLGLLQSPAKRVLAGLLQHHEKQAQAAE
jgi:large subunit ribosomal protein L10